MTGGLLNLMRFRSKENEVSVWRELDLACIDGKINGEPISDNIRQWCRRLSDGVEDEHADQYDRGYEDGHRDGKQDNIDSTDETYKPL